MNSKSRILSACVASTLLFSLGMGSAMAAETPAPSSSTSTTTTTTTNTSSDDALRADLAAKIKAEYAALFAEKEATRAPLLTESRAAAENYKKTASAWEAAVK
jgi:hypothetical protein